MSRNSHIIDLDGPVHYVDHGGTGHPLLMLHGLGGSHLNWESATPLLTDHHRPIAIDLIGFGLTPLAGRRAAIGAQRDLVTRFIEEVIGQPVTLMGNSMGGLVAMVVAADAPDLVERLVLVDPALPMASADNISRTTLQRLGLPLVPFVGPASIDRYKDSIAVEEELNTTMDLLCYDPSRVGPRARARGLEMLRLRREMEWATTAFTQAIRSITVRLLRRRRFFDTVLHRISVPTLLIHGNADVIVAPASAKLVAEERPDWTFVMLPGVGHIPMIEVPEIFVSIVDDWLGAPAVAGGVSYE